MKHNDDFILIRRSVVARFLKDYCTANYAVQLFSYLASQKRLEIHMDTDEVCALLDVTRKQLEHHRRQGQVKSFVLGGVRFFSAFDMAKVAELVHRPERFRKLMRIPGIAPGEGEKTDDMA